MAYFEKKKLMDPNLFFSFNFDKRSDHLVNVFWADGQGKATYRYFHDVVVLDSTYPTNRYVLVFFIVL